MKLLVVETRSIAVQSEWRPLSLSKSSNVSVSQSDYSNNNHYYNVIMMMMMIMIIIIIINNKNESNNHDNTTSKQRHADLVSVPLQTSPHSSLEEPGLHFFPVPFTLAVITSRAVSFFFKVRRSDGKEFPMC